MLVKNVVADVIVVGLVGERGREVREFVEETLGPKAMRRTVIVVATSDQPSLLRQLAPVTATTIAEHFRDRGKNVLLIIDSLTRTARAIRETSLAAGELPVRHGYTPSVYTELPKLVERAGRTSKGTITAAYTVLTNEDGDIDPLADEIKSLLDGHIVLSKDVANQGIRPAIDIVHSISRLMTRFHSKEFLRNSQAVVSAFATLEKERFTVLLGGTPDAKLQKLFQIEPDLIKLLAQETGEYTSFEETREVIKTLAAKIAT
jgi:FliI/YscN family ATPase